MSVGWTILVQYAQLQTLKSMYIFYLCMSRCWKSLATPDWSSNMDEGPMNQSQSTSLILLSKLIDSRIPSRQTLKELIWLSAMQVCADCACNHQDIFKPRALSFIDLADWRHTGILTVCRKFQRTVQNQAKFNERERARTILIKFSQLIIMWI